MDKEHERKILRWLAGPGVGMSSKAIALTALGEMPPNPNYPHDSDDFGRCRKLLELVPEARNGLDHLGKHGGAVWKALVARWDDIESAFKIDEEAGWKTDTSYTLIKEIIRPIEDASGSVIRFKGGAIHF